MTLYGAMKETKSIKWRLIGNRGLTEANHQGRALEKVKLLNLVEIRKVKKRPWLIMSNRLFWISLT